MTNDTPPRLFLSEIGDIAGFIDDIVACPRKESWHWPSFYLLYVDVDRLAGTLARIGCVFDAPVQDASDPVMAEAFVADGNALLAELGQRHKAIVRWVWPLARHIRPCPDDPVPRARLDAHVHPKSGWYQTFFAAYDAGTLAPDGRTLARTVLPALAAPVHDRIDDVTADCMLQRQTFDTGTLDARLALAHATRQAAARLGSIAARMHDYLMAHCELKDLMHPCSA
jgi:hypothetical protein